MKTNINMTLLMLTMMAMMALPATADNVPAGTAIRLTWDASAGADRYKIYEITTGKVQMYHGMVLSSAPITVSVGSHTYVAVALNEAGDESDYSAPLIVVGVVDSPNTPPPPTGIVGTAAGGTITLTWQPRPGSEGVSGYTVYEIRSDGSTISAATTVGPSITFINMSVGLHRYQVAARNAAGEGARSASIAVTVLQPPTTVPSPPTNLRILP